MVFMIHLECLQVANGPSAMLVAPFHGNFLSGSTRGRAGNRPLLPAIFLTTFLFFLFTFVWHTWSRVASVHPISAEQRPDTFSRLDNASPPEPPAPSNDNEVSPLKCSVTKLSMLYGGHRFPELFSAIDSHRKHCQRWGCTVHNLEHELTDRRHFSKQYFILSHMLHELAKPPDQRKDWLMWVDADSIVLNPAISPEAFLPPAALDGTVWALVTADHNGLNNGLFYLRVDYASVDLLTEVIDFPLAHPADDLGWLGEQIAMARVIAKREEAARKAGTPTGIAWVPRLWFNAFQSDSGFEGAPGHHMVHFAGLAETRVPLMARWLAELEVHQDKWEVPFEDTFYRKAFPEFWDWYAANLTMAGH